MNQSVDRATALESQGFAPPSWLRRLQGSRVYDLAMRCVTAGLFSYLLLRHGAALVDFAAGPHGNVPDLLFYSQLAARTALILFISLIVGLALLRARPVAKAEGLQPRFSALMGTTLVFVIAMFPRADIGAGLNILSAALIFGGHCFAAYTLSHLGRSFSLMAEARRLVTTGPYAHVRHPLYVAEEIGTLGLFVQFASPWSALVLAVHFAFQLQRMRNEEAVLSAAFPDYPAYMGRTARIVPGIY